MDLTSENVSTNFTEKCNKESTDLHILNLPNFVSPNPGVSLVECKGCHKSIQPSEYPSHLKSCKVFSRFVKKTSTGFQCQVCLKEDIKRYKREKDDLDKRTRGLREEQREWLDKQIEEMKTRLSKSEE